jgi:hypothetical protein
LAYQNPVAANDPIASVDPEAYSDDVLSAQWVFAPSMDREALFSMPSGVSARLDMAERQVEAMLERMYAAQQA